MHVCRGGEYTDAPLDSWLLSRLKDLMLLGVVGSELVPRHLEAKQLEVRSRRGIVLNHHRETPRGQSIDLTDTASDIGENDGLSPR
jgi:hypothetical protein